LENVITRQFARGKKVPEGGKAITFQPKDININEQIKAITQQLKEGMVISKSRLEEAKKRLNEILKDFALRVGLRNARVLKETPEYKELQEVIERRKELLAKQQIKRTLENKDEGLSPRIGI